MPSGSCASEPAPPGSPWRRATSAARSLSSGSRTFALKTSTTSSDPRCASSSSRRSPNPRRCRSSGCGAYTSPPWPRMRATASSTGSTYGTRSVRNSPISSPTLVRTSSPTTTRAPMPRSIARRAPSRVWWSVMHTTSMSAAATRSASWSSVVVASPDHTVCSWQSTRTSRVTGSGLVGPEERDAHLLVVLPGQGDALADVDLLWRRACDLGEQPKPLVDVHECQHVWGASPEERLAVLADDRVRVDRSAAGRRALLEVGAGAVRAVAARVEDDAAAAPADLVREAPRARRLPERPRVGLGEAGQRPRGLSAAGAHGRP